MAISFILIHFMHSKNVRISVCYGAMNDRPPKPMSLNRT